MTYQDTVDYLDSLPGVLALFWFMENVNDDHPHRSELFFYCRERVRRYSATPGHSDHENAYKREMVADKKLFKLWSES